MGLVFYAHCPRMHTNIPTISQNGYCSFVRHFAAFENSQHTAHKCCQHILLFSNQIYIHILFICTSRAIRYIHFPLPNFLPEYIFTLLRKCILCSISDILSILISAIDPATASFAHSKHMCATTKQYTHAWHRTHLRSHVNMTPLNIILLFNSLLVGKSCLESFSLWSNIL